MEIKTDTELNTELNTLWKKILNNIELQISKPNFVTWIKNSLLIDKNDGCITIALPNNFSKEWVENKYSKLILNIAREYDNSIKKINFIVDNKYFINQKGSNIDSSFEKSILDLRVDPETGLNSKYSLKSFVVGSSNELAYNAALAIIQNVGTKYNPFFVYGGVGLGKTHLIQMIGNEIKNLYKNKIKPKYVPSEKFTNDVVWAIRNKRMDDIKKKYRDIDVLIIDDIQFIGGKEKTEEEFFHTFNSLYENNKQIIISSDRPPQSIPTLEERLRSRFEGGLIVDITYPDYEMRVAIIKNKLQEKNTNLNDNIIDLIAKKVKKNIREIEGVLNKIIFYKETKGGNITISDAEEIINKTIQNISKKITDKQIIKAVSDFFNITPEDLLSNKRNKEIVEPRQIIVYLLREILDLSYPYIGEKLGRDHTTAIHAYEKISNEINKNSTLYQKILLIKESIYKE
ncbi:MAG: chromosomal replication initiator protein DnaA [Patescibacteria group bacterium]|nr:chromosomal replication initiator protein DnaA [Patescibacteria group bacterium]MDW8279902.1 chromosomal replication initiator protein DnaA [bacterium]